MPEPRPLSDNEAVEVIAATTKTGLTIRGELDENICPKAIRVTDKEMATLNIATDAWHPKWNYTISSTPSGRHGNC